MRSNGNSTIPRLLTILALVAILATIVGGSAMADPGTDIPWDAPTSTLTMMRVR